jgi:tRNA(Ile)-lysidine synthase
MIDLFRQTQLNIQNHKLFSGTDKIVIGISGGVDSITLADLLVRYFSHPSEHIILAHVDYHFREDSYIEKIVIDEFAKQNNIKVIHIDYPNDDLKTELAAREFRYNFYKNVANDFQATKIALAHNADEQAETILLKLIRGGDWSQLVGIDWNRPFENDLEIVRPLLNISKKQIYEYVENRQLKWTEDFTNNDPEYAARNLIRNEVLPKLKTINSKASENITDFALRIDNLETNLLPEMLRKWIKKQIPGVPIKESQLEDFSKLIENEKQPYGQIEIADNYLLKKDNKEMKISKKIK